MPIQKISNGNTNVNHNKQNHNNEVKKILDFDRALTKGVAYDTAIKGAIIGATMAAGGFSYNLLTDEFSYSNQQDADLSDAQRNALVEFVPNAIDMDLQPNKNKNFQVKNLIDDTYQVTGENINVLINKESRNLHVKGTIDGQEVDAQINNNHAKKFAALLFALLGCGLIGAAGQTAIEAKCNLDINA